MAILDSIKMAQDKGASADAVIQEIMKQNPSKASVFNSAYKAGADSNAILNEVIKQNGGKFTYVAPQAKTPEKPSLLSSIFKAVVADPIKSLLVRPAIQTGQAIGRVGIEAFGTPEQKARADAALSQPTTFAGMNIEAQKKFGESGAVKQILGQGAESAANIIGLAGVPKVVGAVKPATSILSGATKGVLSAAPRGALVTGLMSGGKSAQANNTGVEIVRDTIVGGAVGGLVSGVIGGIGGGISGGIKGSQLRKTELNKLLADNGSSLQQKLKARNPDLPLADLAKADKTIKEAASQGIDEGQALYTKFASPADKVKMNKMLETARIAQGNPASMNRPTDIVGETFITRAKAAQDVLKKASTKLNEASKDLKGVKVDFSSATANFENELMDAGISIGDGGKLNFVGSKFEGIGSAEKALQNIYSRSLKVGDNATVGHNLKQYVYNILDYSKKSEGITGNAERLIKDLARGVDEVLDATSPKYNSANQLWGQSKDVLDDISDLIGKDLLKNDLGNVKAGTAMRTILSNRTNRADVLQLLDKLETLITKNGYKTKESIVNQVVFADMLDDVFGVQAKTSLAGQVSRGVKDAVSNIGGDNITAAGLVKKGLEKGYDVLTSKSLESQIEAIRKLLK